MAVANWLSSEYRQEVWEENTIRWNVGKIYTKNNKSIEPGDIVYLFYAKTRNEEPGIYGWGIINKYNKLRKRIDYRPVFPSDYLKMNPIWNKKISEVVDNIRGGMKQGTMWEIEEEYIKKLNKTIHNWLK